MKQDEERDVQASQDYFEHTWNAKINVWLLLDGPNCLWVARVTLSDGSFRCLLAERQANYTLLNLSACNLLGLFIEQALIRK